MRLCARPTAPSAVLIAADSFQGTFTAGGVADAIARGAASAGTATDRFPVADGGEGTLDILLAACRGTTRTVGGA